MAKNAGEVSLDAREVMSRIVIIVRLPKMLPARLWIASKLIWLACAVSGFRAEVEIGDDE